MIFNKKNNSNNSNLDLGDIENNDSNSNDNVSDLLNFFSDDHDEDENIEQIIKDAKNVNSTDNVDIKSVGFANIGEDNDNINSNNFNEFDFINSDDLNISNNIDNDLDQSTYEEDIEDEDKIEDIGNILLNDINYSSEIENINEDSNGSRKKDKKGKLFKRNKKDTVNSKRRKDPGFVDINSGALESNEFVIIQDEKKHFKGITKLFKIILTILIFIFLTAITYFCLSYKIVPENVKGSTYDFENFSIVSSSYKANLDELKKGDEIICLNKNSILPFITDYRKYTCLSRNKYIIFVENESGMKEKVESINVKYIVRN